nr:hypothetical protein [uncultured Flavobacterium sp.]
MKPILILFLVSLINTVSVTPEYGYYGKKSFHKIYFEHTKGNTVLVEIGGTSLKMGGKHIVLYKIEQDGEKVTFESNDKDALLIKMDDAGYVFTCRSMFNDKEIKLRKVRYDDDIDRFRKNAFRWKYDYIRVENYEEFEKTYNQFLSNPVGFKKQHKD